MKSALFGVTQTGLGIPSFQFGDRGPGVLILGGVHGHEVEGVNACHGLLRSFAGSFPYALQVTLVPAFNLDGVLAKQRLNARGVDLNRNLPSNDWSANVAKPEYNPGPYANSESENQALVKFLTKEKPTFILSMHSWKPMLNVNGKCHSFAEVVASKTGYQIHEDIGYPTPGCLGTYAGLERDMPTLTYEIERGLAAPEVIRVHVPAILEALKILER